MFSAKDENFPRVMMCRLERFGKCAVLAACNGLRDVQCWGWNALKMYDAWDGKVWGCSVLGMGWFGACMGGKKSSRGCYIIVGCNGLPGCSMLGLKWFAQCRMLDVKWPVRGTLNTGVEWFIFHGLHTVWSSRTF